MARSESGGVCCISMMTCKRKQTFLPLDRKFVPSRRKPKESKGITNTPEQSTSNDKDTPTKSQSGEDNSNGLKAKNVSTGDSEGQNTTPDQLESETKVSATSKDSISSSQGDDQPPAQDAIKDLTSHDTSKNQSTSQDDKDNSNTLDSENQDIARQGNEPSNYYPSNEEGATHNKPSSSDKDELNKLGGANQIDSSPTRYSHNQIEGVRNKSANTNINTTEQENQDITSSEQISFSYSVEVDRSQLIQDAKNVISELAPDEKNSGTDFKKHFLRKRHEYIEIFSDCKNLRDFYKSFAEKSGIDEMKNYTRFTQFKSKILSIHI